MELLAQERRSPIRGGWQARRRGTQPRTEQRCGYWTEPGTGKPRVHWTTLGTYSSCIGIWAEGRWGGECAPYPHSASGDFRAEMGAEGSQSPEEKGLVEVRKDRYLGFGPTDRGVWTCQGRSNIGRWRKRRHMAISRSTTTGSDITWTWPQTVSAAKPKHPVIGGSVPWWKAVLARYAVTGLRGGTLRYRETLLPWHRRSEAGEKEMNKDFKQVFAWEVSE